MGSPLGLFGLGGVPAAKQRGLTVALGTSVATIMGANLVYPVLPAMMEQLQVGPAEIGLVITVFTVPTAFMAPVAGALTDLYGRRLPLFLGLLLFGLAGAGVGLMPSFQGVLLMRALQGAASSALFPLTIVLLSDLFSDEQETSAQGLKVIVDRIATTALPIASGALAGLLWNLPFFLYGLCVPLAFLSLRWFPAVPVTRRSGGFRGYLKGLPEIARYPRLLLAFAAGSLRFFLDYGYFTYLPVYLAVTRGTPSEVAGMLLACMAIGAIVSAGRVGQIVRGRDPARVLLIGFVLSGVSLVVVPFTDSAVLVGASIFVYGLGNGLISPLQKSLLTRNAPADLRVAAVSLDRVFQQIAKTAGPAAVGATMAVAGMDVLFWMLGLLSLASVALAALWLGRREAVAIPAGTQ